MSTEAPRPWLPRQKNNGNKMKPPRAPRRTLATIIRILGSISNFADLMKEARVIKLEELGNNAGVPMLVVLCSKFPVRGMLRSLKNWLTNLEVHLRRKSVKFDLPFKLPELDSKTIDDSIYLKR